MDDKCIRCGKGTYAKVDEETDAQGRKFLLFECKDCKSMVIRKNGWDPKSWTSVK